MMRACDYEQYADETSLTAFPVDPSSSTGTPGALGKALLHRARNAGR